jgi:hypothetical protein
MSGFAEGVVWDFRQNTILTQETRLLALLPQGGDRMNVRIMTLVLIAVVSVCAACQSNSSDVSQNGTLSANSLPALRHYPSVDAMVADAKSLCTAARVKVPGTYVFMNASGDLQAGDYEATGLWFVEQYVLVPPGPTPTPGVTPTPDKSQPVYFYYGTYTLKKHKESGCVFVTATQSGKPFKRASFNAAVIGRVLTTGKYVRGTYTNESGPLAIVINGLTATGGKGGAILAFPGGKRYDTASMKITGRISIP